LVKESRLISIVEDDEFLRASIKRLMRSFGYTVEVFPSAVEFLAFPGFDRTACLIADINMPVMTGIELYHRLIEAGSRIPTILITAYPDEAVRDRALRDGVLSYLKKPFNDEELLRSVRNALDDHRPTGERS
jgi:FixJ family two-component response regulator